MSAVACPQPRELNALAAGTLTAERAAELRAHLATCSTCATSSLAQTTPAGALPSGPTAPPIVGRYELERELGRGAMGLVYLATDLLLGRKVALKLVEGAREGAPSALSRQVAREAQTVARMQHPNVVSLFDVVQAEGGVYLAMEYVEGADLAAWLETPRTREEIVALFTQCADGLAAAHAAGVVHRDFKPANVLVGVDGRARVSDFGLAGFLVERHQAEGNAGLLELARTAASLGTPAYMAPEVWAGQPAGPAADQFSFCVALYEALLGERPFEGHGSDELRSAVLTDGRRPLPAGKSVPRRLLRLLDRGLARDPAQRFPSMREVATELRRTRGGPAVRVALAVAGSVVIAAAGTWATQRRAVCGDLEEHLATLRADVPPQLVSQGLGRLPQPWVPGLAKRAEERLQSFGEAWARMRLEACEATRVRGSQSEALLDRRMLCLTERRQAFTSTAKLLSSGDVEVARRGDALLDALGDLSPCADARSLLEASPRPATETSRERLAAAEAQLTEARVLLVGGRPRDALDVATRVLAEVRLHGAEWDVAGAALVVGSAQHELGDPAASKTLGEAAQLAVRSRNFEVERLAWIERVENAADPVVALALEDIARAAIERVGGPRRDELRTRLEGALGRRAQDAGDYGRAAAFFEAERRVGTSLGPLAQALAEQHLATLAGLQERHDEAVEALGRAAALIEAASGASHPQLGIALNALGSELSRARRFDEAEQTLTRALGVLEASLGARHLRVADVLDNLGWLKAQQGQIDHAEPLLVKAQALRVALAGPDSHEAGRSANNLASLSLMAGRQAEAVPRLEQAAQIYEKTLGPSHPRLAIVLHNLAEARLAVKDASGAVVAAKRSLAIALEVHGPRGPAIVSEYVLVAQAERAAGRPLTDAVKHYEAALALADVAAEEDLALARLSFAELLASTDRVRARVLLEQALPFYDRERKAGRLEDEVKAVEQLKRRLAK
ncbi:MAG: protein kinase [Myxococcaceae bacterium]|nr:protein kinase [Myxococcaceae bacterium]